MKIILAFCVVLILSSLNYAQNLNGRFSSSLYTFERFDSANASATHVRTYQMLTLNFGKQNVWFRTYMNLEGDITEKLVDDPRLRFYSFYLDVKDLWKSVFFKLGRQPLYNSIGGGAFDGATLGFKYSGYKLSAYYGGNVPAYQKLEFTDDLSNDYVGGAELSILALKDWRFALKYIKKNFKTPSYTAMRLDPDLNPINVLIENSSNQFEFTTAEVSYSKTNMFRIDSRYDYDLNFNTTSRFELSGRYEQVENLGLSVYYNYREPRIRYNSIFSVFDYGNTWEIEGGADYKIDNKYTLIGKFANVSYKDETSQRVSFAVSSPWGTLSGRKGFGYAGELDAISLYGAQSILDGFLTPTLGFSFTRYKQSVSSPRNEIVSLLAGTNIRPWRTLSCDIQGQYLNNKIYKNDWRLFFKLNYWFNSNLSL